MRSVTRVCSPITRSCSSPSCVREVISKPYPPMAFAYLSTEPRFQVLLFKRHIRHTVTFDANLAAPVGK